MALPWVPELRCGCWDQHEGRSSCSWVSSTPSPVTQNQTRTMPHSKRKQTDFSCSGYRYMEICYSTGFPLQNSLVQVGLGYSSAHTPNQTQLTEWCWQTSLKTPVLPVLCLVLIKQQWIEQERLNSVLCVETSNQVTRISEESEFLSPGQLPAVALQPCLELWDHTRCPRWILTGLPWHGKCSPLGLSGMESYGKNYFLPV